MTENTPQQPGQDPRPEWTRNYGDGLGAVYGSEQQQPQHAPKKKRKAWLIPAGALVAGLIIGGSSAANAKPEPIVETKTVEKRVEVPVTQTPKSCVAALGYAQDVIDSAGTTIGVLSDTLSAASRLDMAGVNRNNGKIDAQTAIIKGITPKFQNNRDDCLASAK